MAAVQHGMRRYLYLMMMSPIGPQGWRDRRPPRSLLSSAKPACLWPSGMSAN